MKKQYAFVIGAVFIGLFFLWWVGRNKQTSTIKSQPLETSLSADTQAIPNRTTSSEPQKSQGAAAQTKQPTPPDDLEAYGRSAIAAQEAHEKEIREKWKGQWATPISFYGKVVDEGEIPAPDASIGFTWTDGEGEEKRSSTTSGGLGSFSLTGIQSRALSVHIAKEGYYISAKLNQTYFLYADVTGRGTFTPDPSNPVIFHLKKKGSGAELITSQYGVKDYLGVTMPLDGTPVQVRLLERSVGLGGQLQLSQSKPALENLQQAKEWAFRMEIPDGGFIEFDEEFPFQAPETGYEPVVQFNFKSGDTNWATDLRKDYYIKFGDPPRYGRVHLETSIKMGGARLTYAINSDGSRNLESK